MTARSRMRRIALAALAASTLGASLAIAVPATAAPPASPGQSGEHPCTRTLAAGTSTVAVDFDGASYDVLVHVPQAPAAKALPLVLDLHGSNNNGGLQAQVSGLAAVADREGFIVAEPTGDLAFPATLPGGNWAWNVPGVPLTSGVYPGADARDDVAFLRAVVDELDAAGCVDDRRVYATGYSGGGRMASALACEASDLFAAIAPVSGLRAGRPDPADLTRPEAGTCEPANPVAVVTFHGTADFVNPWEGNTADARWGYSTTVAAQTWAGINECAAGPVASAVSPSVTATSWTHCDGHGDVVVYEVAGGGHTWPGAAIDMNGFGLGSMTTEISASEIMWDFFAAHPRRG
ncbi:prolyl oligopeptidase family serine peptidase [Microbacterium sp. NEAU-LLC]|uniref:Prolyl oligopeptidase family serine peptidase n=1 Tax=Microbacterium helvum TaxID=2773713 RepID=A0ABR8NPA5_9MICO|nr:PHB depolymerase family esterase [Microbacterium helvum]MBD3942293.1 prolyl oligopeptidase family serine peptidase [Microbacterium helvum]